MGLHWKHSNTQSQQTMVGGCSAVFGEMFEDSLGTGVHHNEEPLLENRKLEKGLMRTDSIVQLRKNFSK